MERGVGEIVAHGQKNVSEFWEVVGGLQLVVVQDGVSAGHGGGFGGGTDLGAIPGSGGAKEGSEPDVFLHNPPITLKMHRFQHLHVLLAVQPL